jgi:SHS2 domain-containing protein
MNPERPGAGTVSVSGVTGEELFRNAALALAGALTDPDSVVPGGLRDRLRVEAPDADALLLRWLEALLFQLRVNRLVPADVRILRLREGAPWVLEAEVDGELLDPGRHVLRRPLENARVSGARAARTAGGWAATFLF